MTGIESTTRLAELVLVGAASERGPRWRSGERLHHLFEQRCRVLRASGHHDRLAVDAEGQALTYDQLDRRANQLARHLLALGARPGDRIGLLFDQPVHCYLGMLAVLKINAAYVPLDPGFPPDRLSYILRDAGVRMVLCSADLPERAETRTVVSLDQAQRLVDEQDDSCLTESERGEPVDELCYIVYTSGSTGRPKGVAIQHASICNFVRVAAEVYGLRPQDRVYQGMTIAFDFSVEEIWVPLVTGATLVPKPGGGPLIGAELHQFLTARGVTALCCVPTLLATLEEDLPDLRFLLVSGEACPQDLVNRWHLPGRRFLNVYGPTEATVTATWTTLHPNRPVTIGVPLPTYSVVVLDPVEDRALARGELGEIGIAGPGLAEGYVNREDLTDRAFVPDFLGIGNNPSGRIYRTGDLGRVNDQGEVEYHGRLDTQVKIRGFRVELTEIESVLSQAPGIAQAVVSTYEPEPGMPELVAYYTASRSRGRVDPGLVRQWLADHLPGYMVPTYLEELDAIPVLASGKADRKRLPAPSGERGGAAPHHLVAPATDTERYLAAELAQILRVEQVSVDSHFFDDLGANSLLMARLCARTRAHRDLMPVSMREVYLHPTIRSLAAAQPPGTPATPEPGDQAATEPAVSTLRYVLCGALQFLFFLAYSYGVALLAVGGYAWISQGDGLLATYLRAVEYGVAGFTGLCAVPIIAKWLLIGRWKPQQIQVWSLAYLRFWAVKALIRSSPLVLFTGSPLYVLYLRALGATIGPRVVIFSRIVPVCTDLLTIGANTVIRKDSYFTCYRARSGLIHTGPVHLGRHVLVGEATVLDLGTSLGDWSQLGHNSSLQTAQTVPAGQSWHGSPAQPSDVDYRVIGPVGCGSVRRIAFCLAQLCGVLCLYLPLGVGLVVKLVQRFPTFTELSDPPAAVLSNWVLYRDAVVLSGVVFLGALLLGLVLVGTVPKVLNLVLRPDVVYPLYGFHYWAHRVIARLTNSQAFMNLFGDSSYIVHYLIWLGYDLGVVEQTGSNFGLALKHETPFHVAVGTGTMVSDGLSVINADYSSSSFRLSRARIGARSFLGTNVVYPARATTGDNCLFATKVMVPVDGPAREGVGLLGSPSFEIPRSVRRDARFTELAGGPLRRRRLAAKNRHNAATIGIYLFAHWVHFLVQLLLVMIAGELYPEFGPTTFALYIVVAPVVTIGYFVFMERAAMAFRKLRPRFCSIYDPYYWLHERFWKFSALQYQRVLNGTTFKNVVLRLQGVRTGGRVLDNGCVISERSLVTLGRGCTLNEGSTIQGHSLEDGVFKSDHITIGADCTVGINALVHYAVRMGEGAVLDADSFLMKGEEVAAGSRWRGNPARQIGAPPAPAIAHAPLARPRELS
ncbi:non-ribosomal peptide synthetase [Kutzneria viridogrisea]|uniref:Non-ribosomal peptide synthetase-like protein n=1 Tax=Kutzneria viridogrisea TaxID=47990 RepID=A0ABR6BZM1_9PSEU|nr:non-ribosomal peptide synthetase-like protein [Kutzneria viridogrisea]